MMDLPPPPAPLFHIEAAAETIWPAKRKRNRTSRTALIVGTILLMPDGTECRVIIAPNGEPFCAPLPPR